MMMNPNRFAPILLILSAGAGLSRSFLTNPTTAFQLQLGVTNRQHHRVNPVVVVPTPLDRRTTSSSTGGTTTSLNLLLDVPDGFFTITFPMLGILLSISKNFGRVRMEERAWEQRLEEARMARLEEDPTLTELDLRRKEAALEWSAYGKPRMQQEEQERRAAEAEVTSSSRRRGRRRQRVQVMDGPDDDTDPRQYRMSEEEIEAFELEYGVEYDPYYDDPYAEDELPEGKFDVDRMYGDRIYENGEIFYKDASTNLYYRQGCKPRNLSFWG